MKKKSLWLPALLLALTLTACGPSSEKLAQAQEAINLMTGAGQTANETFLDITDTSFKARLDELSAKETELAATDLTKLNDKKIDELLPSINEVTDAYNALNAEMSQILTTETAEREERGKHNEQKAYLVNKTGMNLSEIKLHDISSGTVSDNYLGEGVILQDGYTLMGVSLDLYSNSSSWEFIIKNDVDTEFTLPCPSLFPPVEDGVSVELIIDPVSGEGSVNVGGYVVLEETVTDEAATEADSEADNTTDSASTDSSDG